MFDAGLSFGPNGNSAQVNKMQADQAGQPGGTAVQQAIRVLAMRMPKMVGQFSPISRGLLQGQGSAGLGVGQNPWLGGGGMPGAPSFQQGAAAPTPNVTPGIMPGDIRPFFPSGVRPHFQDGYPALPRTPHGATDMSLLGGQGDSGGLSPNLMQILQQILASQPQAPIATNTQPNYYPDKNTGITGGAAGPAQPQSWTNTQPNYYPSQNTGISGGMFDIQR